MRVRCDRRSRVGVWISILRGPPSVGGLSGDGECAEELLEPGHARSAFASLLLLIRPVWASSEGVASFQKHLSPCVAG
jgi:hypothetical protein